MQFEMNESVAMLCVTVLAACALYWLPVDGGKDIALAAVAGIVGYISKGMATK